MIKALKKNTSILFYYENDVKKIGAHPRLSGNCSRLFGDCSRLSGNCSRLSGDCSGLSGDCSGIYGDLDACNLTAEERATRVDINDLIEKEVKGDE